jgi:threonine/homoserine/homoserine lactone efflux protein
MLHLNPVVLAALTGLVSGLLLSIPVGPINLTIMNEGARRGFWAAALIGFGASVMEVIYCFIAFTGFASFFQRGYVQHTMELISFVFLLYLGIRFLTTKSVGEPPVKLGATATKIGLRIEEHCHPHSDFMTGLVRVMGNVGVFLFWILLAGNFISREWVTPDWPGKLACVTGVAIGTGLWFTVLSWLASLGKGKLKENTLLRMERISGLILVALALAHGGTIVWKMHRHEPVTNNKIQGQIPNEPN